MDLALSDDQIEFQRAARRFAADRLGTEGPLGERAWRDIATLGWLGLALPVAAGGSGASMMDVAVIFEEIGRAAASPLVFDTAVLAPAVLNALDEPWAADALTALVGGDTKVAVLVANETDLPGDQSVGMRHDTATDTVSGSAASVRDAVDVDRYLVIAPAAGQVVVAMVDARADGIVVRERQGFAPHHHMVAFENVVAQGIARLSPDRGDVERVRRAILDVIPIQCAYQVGSCQRVYEMSVDYSRERVQFGKPIGTFQRVQDHIIELINGTDSARWVTNHAIWLVDSQASGDEREMAVHVAKAVTARAHVDACTSAHEVHAGIGADLQYGLARHTFASRTLYAGLGDPAWHRRQIARRFQTIEAVT